MWPRSNATMVRGCTGQDGARQRPLAGASPACRWGSSQGEAILNITAPDPKFSCGAWPKVPRATTVPGAFPVLVTVTAITSGGLPGRRRAGRRDTALSGDAGVDAAFVDPLSSSRSAQVRRNGLYEATRLAAAQRTRGCQRAPAAGEPLFRCVAGRKHQLEAARTGAPTPMQAPPPADVAAAGQRRRSAQHCNRADGFPSASTCLPAPNCLRSNR